MARWTDLAEWVGPTVNSGDGDGRPGEPEDRMYECRGLVLHIAEGTYAGTIAWQRNPAADVSSHFIVAKDGRCAQMVDTAERAWTQAAGNGYWLSVECEGYSGQQLTAAQVEVIAKLYARGVREHGWPLQPTDTPSGRGLGWHGMGGAAWGNHPNCPGLPIRNQRPAILARAKQLLGQPSTREDDVIYARTKSDPLVWVSDGIRRRPIATEGGIVGGFAAVHTVKDEAALTDLCGPPATDPNIDYSKLADEIVKRLPANGSLPAAVVDKLARLGDAIDALVAATRAR